MDEYLEAADRHLAIPVSLPAVAWRAYADRVVNFSARYREQVDDQMTAMMRQWRSQVGPLAKNDWLMFAMTLFDISTRQAATRNDSQRRWIDFDFARFLDLLDVNEVLAWNATVTRT